MSGVAPDPLDRTVADLTAALEATEAYAKEGWDWLSVALDALGVETVFEIEQRRELLARIFDHAYAGYQEHLARRQAWVSREPS